MTYFFLSYARFDENGDEPYVARFFQDLQREVRSLLGLAADAKIGFRDTGINPGETWPDELKYALQQTRCMVSLYSPTYFTRAYCGKEWSAFQSRLQTVYPGNHPPLIIPVLWELVTPRTLPACATKLQYAHEAFGDLYVQQGLRQLMRLNRNRDDYLAFVRQFALKLVAAVEQHPLTPAAQLLDLAQYANAFATIQNQAVDITDSPGRGPKSVNFILVAASQAEMQAIRQQLVHYGASALDWRPYYPQVDKRIAPFVQLIAARDEFISEFLTVQADLVDKLEQAERNNSIVVIIVDAWTTWLDQYQQLMASYDRHNSLNCAALIIWNHDDAETQRQRADLETHLRQTFRYRLAVLDSKAFKANIGSLSELESELRDTLVEVRQRIIGNPDSPVPRRAKGDRIIAQPQITN